MTAFENRRLIFEGVHRSFKFAALSFEKHGRTESFPATFKLRSLADPARPIRLETELIRQLSPDSLSILEVESALDVGILQKLVQHLGSAA